MMVDMPEDRDARERRVAQTMGEIAAEFEAFTDRMLAKHPLLEVNVGLALRENEEPECSAALSFRLSSNCAGALTVATTLLRHALAQAKRAGMPAKDIDEAIEIAQKRIRDVSW